MSNSILFSVIIPTYRRPELLSTALSNLSKQTYENFEVIVVDDNGKDSDYQQRTSKQIKPIIEKDSRIKYIVQEQNSGACSARNTGIRKSEGDYIAFLDDDDYWNVDFLMEMSKVIIESNASIIYSNFYRKNEKGIYYNKYEENHSGNIRDFLIRGWCAATTSLFCIKKSCFYEVGFFSEELKNLEEYDLWIRMSEKFNFTFLDKYLVIKNESLHEQLTNNYTSRIRAWEDMYNLWENRLSEKDKCFFYAVVKNGIDNSRYHHIIQKIEKGESIVKLYKEIKLLRGNYRYQLLIIWIVGPKVYYKIKNLYTKLTRCIVFLSKDDVKEARNLYHFD